MLGMATQPDSGASKGVGTKEKERTEMSPIKLLLLGLLAALAVGSVTSASASALNPLKGALWMKSEQAKQVKINTRPGLQLKISNSHEGITPFRIVTKTKTIECQSVTGKSLIWNGSAGSLQTGVGEGVLLFSECTLQEPGCPATRTATLSQAKIYSFLVLSGKDKEGIGQRKIYDNLSPSHAPQDEEFGKMSKLRAEFLTIKVPHVETCAEKSIILYSHGSTANWDNQQQKELPILWGTAAQVEPQNQDKKFVTLNWRTPNERIFGYLRNEFGEEFSEDQTWLLLEGVEEAEIEGKIYLEEASAPTEFGAWDTF